MSDEGRFLTYDVLRFQSPSVTLKKQFIDGLSERIPKPVRKTLVPVLPDVTKVVGRDDKEGSSRLLKGLGKVEKGVKENVYIKGIILRTYKLVTE